MRISPSRYELLQARTARLAATLKRLRPGDASSLSALHLSVRRLRELLPMLQLDAGELRKVDARLRKTARRLKPVVKTDGLLGQAEGLAGSDRASRAAEVRLKNELRRSRLDLGVAGLVRKSAADLKKVLVKLNAMAEELKDARESSLAAGARRWAIRARVSRRAADLKQALADAGSVYLPGRLSALRRASWRLRLGTELLADGGGPVSFADVKALERMSDALDRLRDNETLIRHLRRLQRDLAPADLKAWQEFDAAIAPLEYRCRRLHARYVREREALTHATERLGERLLTTSSKRKVS